MPHLGNRPVTTKKSLCIQSLPKSHRRIRHSSLLFAFCLSILLFAATQNAWPLVISQQAYASAAVSSPPVTTTLQKFLQQGMQHTQQDAFHFPQQTSKALSAAQQQLSKANLPPSAQPATMAPLQQVLGGMVLAGSARSQSTDLAPLEIVGSDQHLRIQIPYGGLDLSQAKTVSGAPIQQPVTLKLSQIHGHFVGAVSMLASYQLELVDAQGRQVQVLHLKKPATFVYTYQPDEMTSLDLDPGKLMMSWPDLAASLHKTADKSVALAMAANVISSDAVTALSNNSKVHTLTAQSLVLAAGPLDVGSGTSANQSPPTPHTASVQGNSGQVSYSYPLQVAPGSDGTTPQLAVAYSSENTNERHSPTSPAGGVGDGWSLSMGSITSEVNSGWSAGVGTWYFISGIDHVGERLVPDSTGTHFLTEHISQLKVQQVTSSFGQPCFDAWGSNGSFYTYGCSQDSLQYSTDSMGTRTNYRWDMDGMTAPNEGPGTDHGHLTITYVQDIVNGNTVRDAAIKQITYGQPNSPAGTVDFRYLAPSANAPWTTTYGTNANGCRPPDGLSTTLRCDDPLNHAGGLNAPSVMSTLSLQSVTSYLGDDSSASHKLASYQFGYQDNSFGVCNDDYSQLYQYCAGQHLLTRVTPTVYQNGNGTAHKAFNLSYTSKLVNDYYDTTHSILNGTQQYHMAVYWSYLASYQDAQLGTGGSFTYLTAYNNANGTPSSGGDDRTDPVYCSTHSDCTGAYGWPENRSWSTQVITSETVVGKDSSAASLGAVQTTYHYQLAVVGNGCPAAGSDTRCVGDTWIPMGNTGNKDGDWQAYFHGEYRGFQTAFLTGAAGNLTVDTYTSTSGWFTTQGDPTNYTSGSLVKQDVYQGSQVDATKLLIETTNTYGGQVSGTPNTCNGNYSGVYTPCEVMMTSSRTTSYEGNTTGPWVQHDDTYDDYTPVAGLIAGYHNLNQEVITSSNAPTITKKWTYQVTDTNTGSWIYYNVHKVIASEVDDASGHVWQCQETSYDDGRPSSVPSPSAGWVTAQTAHSDCSSQTAKNNTALTSYTGYDQYGNAVASVDAFGAANSSLYSTKGCTLSTAPSILSPAWTQSHYTACTTYDTTHGSVLPLSTQNVLGQTSSIAYDYTQGELPISATDANGQTATKSYSYDSNGNATLQVKQPGALSSYSSQSQENSQCTTSSTLPCYEIDTHSALYANAVKRTFYDNMRRAVETRSPLDASHDTIVFTVHDDAHNSVFQSVPFRVPSGTNWLDPNGAKDENNAAPGGTITVADALGRPLAVQNPIAGTLTCGSLGGTWNTCISYGLGTASGESAVYHTAADTDANGHFSVSFTDALGRARYSQLYSTGSSMSSNITKQTQTKYNLLGEPTAVSVTDLAPQSGQTITSVTTTATYNDLGQQLTLSDPDRGTHTSSYDADGRVIKDVSGSRTIGVSYDLAGRAICEQDAAPTTDGSGSCSSGSHPLVQNTYDVSKLGASGTTDFSIGQLTQSVATTYYPDGTSSTATEQAQHDQRGRAVTATLQIAVPSSWGLTSALPTYQETQNYNDANQPMTVQTNSGGNVDYTFSQAYDSTTGTLTGLSNNTVGAANLVSQQFDLHGQVSDLNFQTTTGTALANEHFTYDGNLRSTSTAVAWQSGSGSTGSIFGNARTYDPVGNVSSVSTTHAVVSGQSNSGGSDTQNFCYDTENRLIWAGNQGAQPAVGTGTCGSGTLANTLSGASYSGSYAYTNLGQQWQGPIDGNGQQQQSLYCDSSHPHQLQGLYPIGTTCATSGTTTANYSLSYDSWGNVTSRTYAGVADTLSYDVSDHLVQWSGTNTTTQQSTGQQWSVYDASGQRVLQRSTLQYDIPLTVYAFGSDEHDYTATGQGSNNLYYYSLGGRLIGIMYSSETDALLTDAEGSVLSRLTTTAGSAVVKGNQVYSPYGSKLYSSGSMGTTRGFTGQYKDATGLNYYNARYYDSVAGRFISADVKQGNAQGMDPYAYVNGNPETLTDPTGQTVSHCHDPSDGCGRAADPNYFKGVTNPSNYHCVFGMDVRCTPPSTQPVTTNPVTQFFNWVAKIWHAVTTAPKANPPCVLSFAPQTRVTTSHGASAIVSLHVGEKVLAYNPASHKMEFQSITHVWINHDNDLVDLTLIYTTSGHKGQSEKQTSEVVHTNQKHPFLTVEDGFIPVSQLHVGMHVVRATGDVGIVTTWQSVPGAMAMYNLEVAQDHTYTVGDGQWVVHNCTEDGVAQPEETNTRPSSATYQNGATNDEFDPTGLKGASLNDIIARLPPTASQVPWVPGSRVSFGIKWEWQTATGTTYTVWYHTVDSGAPASSNSSVSAVLRVSQKQVNKATKYGDSNGKWWDAGQLNPRNVSSPPGKFGTYDAAGANDTHIPVDGFPAITAPAKVEPDPIEEIP